MKADTTSIGSTYNIAAPWYNRLIKAFAAGEVDQARRLQSMSAQMIRTIGRYPFHAALKAVLNMRGFDVGGCRLPQGRLSNDEAAQLRSDLDAIGYFECSSSGEMVTEVV